MLAANHHAAKKKFTLPGLKYRQRLRVVIKQYEGAADRPTWQQVARLILSERPADLLRSPALRLLAKGEVFCVSAEFPLE